MATKKSGGSTRNGRDSESKRLGLKRGNQQIVLAGNILVRQRGKKFRAGENVIRGKDDTLHAAVTGVMTISKRAFQDRNLKNKKGIRRYISVQPVVADQGSDKS